MELLICSSVLSCVVLWQYHVHNMVLLMRTYPQKTYIYISKILFRFMKKILS